MKRPSNKHQGTSGYRGYVRDGFTLIELLVSMAILVVIVLIVSLVFQRASEVWETGRRKAELDMTGRGLADFIAQELSMAVSTNASDFDVDGDHAKFLVLGDADTNGNLAVRSLVYSGAGVAERNGEPLAEDVEGVDFKCEPSPFVGGLPQYADVTVSLTNNFGEPIKYQSRAYFANRNRYRY